MNAITPMYCRLMLYNLLMYDTFYVRRKYLMRTEKFVVCEVWKRYYYNVEKVLEPSTAPD
jgi:hypothetical protein